MLKEVFLILTLGRHPLKMWVFVANITNELILGLNILCMHDASVDLWRQMLRLAEEKVWSPNMGPWPSSLVVANDEVIPAQCEGVVMAQLGNPIEVENGLVELSPEAHTPEGLYSQHSWEVPVRVLNVTDTDQELTKGFPMLQQFLEPQLLQDGILNTGLSAGWGTMPLCPNYPGVPQQSFSESDWTRRT
jgi:hypothetical protein